MNTEMSASPFGWLRNASLRRLITSPTSRPRWSGPSDRRAYGGPRPGAQLFASFLAGLVALMGAGCGSPSTPSSGPAAGGGATPHASPVAPTGASAAASPVAAMGPSVAVSGQGSFSVSNGFLYRVSVSTPKLAAQVGGNYNRIAPPGQDYITLVLRVANAASDRPEPAPVFNGAAPLELEVPRADMGAFGQSSRAGATTGCPAVAENGFPAGVCGLNIARPYLISDPTWSTSEAPNIPVGGSEDLLLFVDQPVPSSAPVGDITVYWIDSNPVIAIPDPRTVSSA